MTEYLKFLALPALKGKTIAEPTLRLWHCIYGWVEAKGYADTADTPEFVQHIQAFRKIGTPTIAGHLAKMADAGLLKRHNLKRQLSAESRDVLLNGIGSMFSGAALPTTFSRYTLPGQICPKEFKGAHRKAEKLDALFADLRGSAFGKPA